MGVIEDVRRTATVLLVVTGFTVVAWGGSMSAPAAQHDWLDALMEVVVFEQANEGPLWGAFAPYVSQLSVVRVNLLNEDAAAVYAAMNRFMDMLERRENGIPPEVADRLFDYCYVVTPARYHDVSRHIDKFIEHQFGESVG